MIPFGLSESQFLERYRSILESAIGSTLEQLRSLMAQPLEPGVSSAQIEIFLDEYGGAPDVWMYFDGRNKKVDKADTSLFAGRSLPLQLDLLQLSEFDEQYFEFESFPGCDLAADALKAWLAECWHRAGGESYCIPVSLSIHDGFGDGKVLLLSRGGAQIDT